MRALGLLFAVAVALAGGCRNQNPVIVPNRVLDRPLDAVLACVQRNSGDDVEDPDDDFVEVLALSDCSGAGLDTDCDDPDEPRLVGFVANNQKNEIGMFRRCDQNGMVDLDAEAPGYNLVPVGAQPQRIVRSEDCRVVTANAGSCDLSAVDLRGLASYAVGLTPEGAPSALATTIVPRKSDGTPLGAKPGDMIAVPRELSLGAVGVEMPDNQAACDPNSPASVYVTFPACQLVAEVDLVSHTILQSRQFVTGEDGTISVVDAGPDPECPIECPAQFEDGVPESPPAVEDGVFPSALALVAPDPQGASEWSLFVGGNGSDEIYEITIEVGSGGGAALGFVPPEELRRVLLEQPAGVQGIRATPVMLVDGELHQFLYVIAGDGSTHVVDRETNGPSVGVECDTNVDPVLATSRACHPIDPGSQTSAAERRPFAAGPGIRGPIGSTITDWAFQVSDVAQGADETRAPYGRDGVVGIGVTSFGRVVLVLFGQYDDSDPTIATVDPLGLMNVEIRPHMLWPVEDPENQNPAVFPLVSDEEPRRVLPADDNPTQVLAPAVRRIDFAYVADVDANGDSEFSADQLAIAKALNNPENEDRLALPDEEGFYTAPVARVAVRDYRQWRGGQVWALLWEGAIPGTESATGRIVCDSDDPQPHEGEIPGGCHLGDRNVTDTGPAEVRLVDEGATFCDEGVLPGDKLVLFGCGSDDECGLGQRCLRDPSSGGATSGICVSQTAYENDLDGLRARCAPFISDPCEAPRREYVITRATQTELAFAEIDIPATTFVRETCPVASGQGNVLDPDGGKPLPEPAPAPDPDGEPANLLECEARLTCATPVGVDAPSGGCATDSDCVDLGGATGAEFVCIEGICRTPCEGGSFNCRQMVLPGTACFGEFVRYAVTLRNEFRISIEPAAQFIADRVITDPDTGECREDPTVSNLLTSRLPLGRDTAATFERIPDCPISEAASPADPNPCRIATAREESAVYHYFRYYGDEVPAIRISNPFGTLVLDLVSLIDLGKPTDVIVPEGAKADTRVWPNAFTEFRRGRIPRNYREEFATPTPTGYLTFNDVPTVQSTPLTYPVRVLAAPEIGAAYIVDAGGRGGVAGVRGQVMRIQIENSQIRGDENFRVR